MLDSYVHSVIPERKTVSDKKHIEIFVEIEQMKINRYDKIS